VYHVIEISQAKRLHIANSVVTEHAHTACIKKDYSWVIPVAAG